MGVAVGRMLEVGEKEKFAQLLTSKHLPTCPHLPGPHLAAGRTCRDSAWILTPWGRDCSSREVEREVMECSLGA